MAVTLPHIDECAMSVFRKVADLMKAGKANSLTEYAKNTRVEPIAVVDKTIASYEGTVQVMQSLTNLFAAYYLQAFTISATVGNIEVNKHLERFNPNRRTSDNILDSAGTLLSVESQKLRTFGSLDMQAAPPPVSGVTISRGTDTNHQELVNLSVGKLITVEIKDNGNVASIPISVRLIAMESTPTNLVNILSSAADLKSMSERYEGLKLGRLAFWRDIVGAQDLIDAHRKRLSEDKTGIYYNARTRASSNFWSGIFSLNPSVATASNIVVMSKETAKSLELATSYKLDDFKSREKIFDQMYVMLMAVVDPEWDRVTIYTRDIPESNKLSMSALKSVNRGTGPNVSEILSAYQLGKAPNL